MTTQLTRSFHDIVRAYRPSIYDTLAETQPTSLDEIQLSNKLFPGTHYNEIEKNAIIDELERSESLPINGTENMSVSKLLHSLNKHFSNRATLLGTKPSVADIVLYARLVYQAKSWSEQQQTGENGLHHLVRYIDFVQHSRLFCLDVPANDFVSINPDSVVSIPKPLDPKVEKERKKKEKAGMDGSDKGQPMIVNQGRETQQSTPSGLQEEIGNETSSLSAISRATAIVTSPSVKKEKKAKKDKPSKQPAVEKPLSPSQIDLRVGHILKAITHPNADSLYVSTIAVGDAPGTENTFEYEGQIVRTVCSGLNGLIPLEKMQDRKIVAVCNLKPVMMRGIKSAAMVLAASPRLKEGETDNHQGPVELVNPPSNVVAGERIIFEGWEGEPEPVLNPKKKIWDMCQVGFTTTEDLSIAFDKSKVEQLKGVAGEGKPDLGRLQVRGGKDCYVDTLKNAVVR